MLKFFVCSECPSKTRPKTSWQTSRQTSRKTSPRTAPLQNGNFAQNFALQKPIAKLSALVKEIHDAVTSVGTQKSPRTPNLSKICPDLSALRVPSGGLEFVVKRRQNLSEKCDDTGHRGTNTRPNLYPLAGDRPLTLLKQGCANSGGFGAR